MTELIAKGAIQEFDEEKREFDMFVLPWDVEVSTQRGLESFARGAFADIDPGRFILRQRHMDPPTGRGVALEERDDGLHMRTRVARTAAGDEQITLYREGIETGVSVGFEDGEAERTKAADGRLKIRHTRVNPNGVLEVSTTYKPAFSQAAILQMRERDDMAEEPQAVTEAAPAASAAVTREDLQAFQSTVMSKFEDLQERAVAKGLNIPALETSKPNMVRKVELQIRELADVITTGNEGVVPDSLVNEMLGMIDTGRPFLNNTRRLQTPPAGVNLVLPKITQRPLVGVQAAEKDELASRATTIGTVDFPMITIGGAADISMQLIKRSSPEFLNLWLELLGQAYATMAEDKAIDALLAEAAVVEGGALDVAAPQFGGAFTNAASATGRTMAPDRIFLSTAAIAAFIDAVEPTGGGGRPLYPGLASIDGLTSGGSLPGGFNLKPVWVPELDDETPDVIVGPSRAFAWAEDGTYTLQADVPAKFGRDVGLAGMIWYAPLYPAAFTSYTLGS